MPEIDLVYLWVDGNDPQWRAKRDATIGKPTDSEDNCRARFVDNDELKYSLRSIDRYAPWIRRIFIVTDGQKPAWLNTDNPRVQIVDHTQIMPPECLPCFNSAVIEHHLHLIPGLAERFIYANDDMLLYRPAMPETFFAADGFPIVRMRRLHCRKLFVFFKEKVMRHRLNTYAKTIDYAARLVEKMFGHYYGCRTHHNIDAYLRSNYALTRQLFDPQIAPTLPHHLRSQNDVQRNIYTFTALATRCAHLQYVDAHTSLNFRIDHIHLHHEGYLNELLRKYQPTFLCLNDTQFGNDGDREAVRRFLEEEYPEKSQFER